jgi:uncharacterized protein YaaQ
MKLIVSIVHSDDAQGLVRALAAEGYRSTTISTTGGFLREGNATILVGTEAARADAVLGIIRDSCRARSKWVSPPPLTETGELYAVEPVEVQIGGATVFVLDVERMQRF